MSTSGSNNAYHKEEMRMLNCVYLLMCGSPASFTPFVVNNLAPPYISNKTTPAMEVLKEVAKGLHPDSETRGEITIGDFHASSEKFYNTVMDVMAASGFGFAKKDDRNDLKLAIALALGADNFEGLEVALKDAREKQRLSAEREKLVQDLAPVFVHISDGFANRINPARQQKELYAGDLGEGLIQEKKIMVWTTMASAMTPVQAALEKTIRVGELDQKAVYYLGEKVKTHEEKMPGITEWAAPAKAMLEGALEVVRENLEARPNSLPLNRLLKVLETADLAYEAAKLKEPPGYPKGQPKPWPNHSWAGPLPAAATAPTYIQ